MLVENEIFIYQFTNNFAAKFRKFIYIANYIVSNNFITKYEKVKQAFK